MQSLKIIEKLFLPIARELSCSVLKYRDIWTSLIFKAFKWNDTNCRLKCWWRQSILWAKYFSFDVISWCTGKKAVIRPPIRHILAQQWESSREMSHDRIMNNNTQIAARSACKSAQYLINALSARCIHSVQIVSSQIHSNTFFTDYHTIFTH